VHRIPVSPAADTLFTREQLAQMSYGQKVVAVAELDFAEAQAAYERAVERYRKASGQAVDTAKSETASLTDSLERMAARSDAEQLARKATQGESSFRRLERAQRQLDRATREYELAIHQLDYAYSIYEKEQAGPEPQE